VVGEGVHAIIPNPVISTRFSAIGKYAYIVLSEDKVDFGEVFSGTPADRTTKEVRVGGVGTGTTRVIPPLPVPLCPLSRPPPRPSGPRRLASRCPHLPP